MRKWVKIMKAHFIKEKMGREIGHAWEAAHQSWMYTQGP